MSLQLLMWVPACETLIISRKLIKNFIFDVICNKKYDDEDDNNNNDILVP